jgi:TPR repeat protein
MLSTPHPGHTQQLSIPLLMAGAGGANTLVTEKTEWDGVSWAELKVVAESGDCGAQCALGKKIAQEYGRGSAVRWFRAAAKQGHAEAQTELGFCFWFGQGVNEDGTEAVSWFRKASEQGYALAQSTLGHVGLKVGVDFAEAASWLRKAAEQGDAEAQFSLGRCLEDGQGVNEDFAEAARWYRNAAEQGHAKAQKYLGDRFNFGDVYGYSQNFAEAGRWYRKAAEQGHAKAQDHLGKFYFSGIGVGRDRAEAASWFRKAAEQGVDSSCRRYGAMLMEGIGVVCNCDEALVWLRKADWDTQSLTYGRIENIQSDASDLASETASSAIVERIRAGVSVFGTTPEGDTLLHTVAMNLVIEPVSLLLEHPLFDDLVVRTNADGQLPRDVVGKQCSALQRDGSATARVIASALSCRRSTRAACLLWCVQHAWSTSSLGGSRVALPREVAESIARFVISPRDMVSMLRVTGTSALSGGLAVSEEHAKDSKVAKRRVGGVQDDCEEPESKRAKSDP